MQICVIVGPRSPAIDVIVGNIRKAGFNQLLHLFVHPNATLEGLTLEGVMLRRLKDLIPYGEMWRNIVGWWAQERNNEPNLCLLDASCELCVSTYDTLTKAIQQPIAWGFVSLYLPYTDAFYFSESTTGWNGYARQMPLHGVCLSRHAADILIRDPLVMQANPNSSDFPAIVSAALARRSLIQAVHYPSLMTTTLDNQQRGLRYDANAVYVGHGSQ